MKTMLLTCCLVIMLGITCVQAIQGDEDPRSVQAEKLASQLMGQLKQELLAGLKQGPESAINICRMKAPQISKQLSTSGVQIGRVSHRPRNQENQIQSWQSGLMEEYLHHGDQLPSQSILLKDGSLGFVKPIYMVPPCLRCHGENISAQLLHEIEKHYPRDQAQGFKIGELRGLVWVIIQ